MTRLLELRRAGALGQSYLFAGPEGSGKELTALEIARLVNCRTPDECTDIPVCESCRKAVSFQHPDIRWICPAPAAITEGEVGNLLALKQEDPFHQPAFIASSEVLIGDPDHPGALTVRSLLHFLRVRPFQGSLKTAIVGDANRLRTGAANAFLKMLEEPPADALIILLTSLRGGLLPTIRSRCQLVQFEPYAEDELGDLLADLYGLPAPDAVSFARAASGNARRAASFRLPEARALRAWARQLLTSISEERHGAVLVAAEQLHKGVVPDELASAAEREAGGRPHVTTAKELTERRDRAIRLCESLNLYYSDILGCATRGEGWRPKLTADERLIRDLAGRRSPAGLLQDIEAVERARRGIDRNLNIGLVMAVLFQELLHEVEADRTAAGT
ncbi:hypothetical protein KKA85_01500 [bacterium]|nr:hypothetical protein [bacterium]MBU1674434.1 hypothetical protein [bacterium]